MNIGILGSGDVAKALAAGFLNRGDNVMLGTREPEKLADWKANAGPHASVGSTAQTAEFGQIIVLATNGMATLEVIEASGEGAFADKTVIDATNPIRENDDGPYLAIGLDDSLGERIQNAIPRANVVKAFNTVGSPEMVNPKFAGGPPTMFIAGEDDAAKAEVTRILHDFGWDTADLGGIHASRYLEPMCFAWIAYGIKNKTWHHAFKMLT
jgi:8-hydroxy-5-deazaflavin:NADPH oxidoreductase